MGDIYFNGSALAAGKKVKFNGSDMANVYLNGTKIWTYYTPSEQSYTSSSTYNINESETAIQYKASGGAGGGGKNQCKNCTPIHGGAGGDTTLSFQKADGTVVHTITASGGAGGLMGGNSCQGTQTFSVPSGWSTSLWDGSVSNGGRGAFGEENCIGGCPGQAGGTASGTYTIPTSGNIPTKVVITIGGGGAGNRCGEPEPSGNSVAGQSGAAWILGVQ